jgi:hypothetical protein
MTTTNTEAVAVADVAAIGPLPDAYHLHELPGHNWLTCRGCPAFRVFDWHYFYCRHLGDQSQPDAWNAGWKRIGSATYKDAAPCGLAVRQHLEQGATAS